MKRLSLLGVVLAIPLSLFPVSSAAAGARRLHKHGARMRSVVVVHAGWPLRRPLRAVIVHPVRRSVRVGTRLFLPPIVWVSAVVPLPPPDRILWQDGETIEKDEDWAELTLNVERSGKRLDLEIRGAADLDFAEVVYDDGESQVVDFDGKTVRSGVYPLVEPKGRTVDHVRVVARAKGDEAKVSLLSES
jgi:hypothetical protein